MCSKSIWKFVELCNRVDPIVLSTFIIACYVGLDLGIAIKIEASFHR